MSYEIIKKAESLSNRNWSRVAFVLGGGLWILVITAGFSILAHEEFTPAANLPPVSIFPQDSDIKLASDKPTLLFFAHPHCPCTRASLHELDGLLSHTGKKVSVLVVFIIPRGVQPGWEEGDLWKSAANISGVRVLRDQDGMEATRFGVKGSGHVLLYDPSGKLLFSGGITPSRGHEGDNPGRLAVIDLVLNGHSLVSHTPVFGCSLL